MYKFADWFIEYMKHIDDFCNIDTIKNKICEPSILKDNYDLLKKYPEFISCALSCDEDAVDLLNYHKSKICWSNLSSNPKAIHILEKYPENIDWYWLSMNIGAKELILKNIDKLRINFNIIQDYKNYISWKLLHYNYEAIDILDMYKESINWAILSYINHEKAINYLLKNVEHINWTLLSFNECAHSIFITYPEYVDWKYLSLQPFAINILTNHQAYIDWDYLSFNENAIPLLKNNIDKVNWRAIMFNKNGKEIIENNLDNICWTEWKIFTQLIKKLDKLDKKVYAPGIDYINIITNMNYDLKQNYKNNLNYFGKCFIYDGLFNVSNTEIINHNGVNFYVCGNNYSHLLRNIEGCVYPAIHTFKMDYIRYAQQIDRPFAQLVKDASTFIGPSQFNPINAICNNIEFKNIIQENPDKIRWIFKLLDSLYSDENLYTEILDNIDIITLDYQQMAIERTNLLREELMMKVWHPSNVERWLNSGFTIDDL